MPHDDHVRPRPRNGVGDTALILGVVAFIFAFVPIVGEFVAAPAALAAIVLGLVGFERTLKGLATNTRAALIGTFLGLAAGLIVFLVFVAGLGPMR